MSTPMLGRSAKIEMELETRELLGTGNGTNDTFYLDYPPIVADSQVVWVDDVQQVETTDYTINDTTGEIVFTTPPGAGEDVEATYKVEIGYAENVRHGINADTIKKYVIGGTNPDRPKVLESGNKAFPFSFDLLYIRDEFANKVLNGTKIEVTIYPEVASGSPLITLTNAVITGYEQVIAQDGIILESASGEGRVITLSSQP